MQGLIFKNFRTILSDFKKHSNKWEDIPYEKIEIFLK